MKEALRNIDKGWFATKILERELSHEQMSNIFLCIISFTIVICGSYMIIYVKECAEESIEKEGREAE
jgi:hypothetical protein